jgi:hypothetical protein
MKVTQAAINRYLNKNKKHVSLKAYDIGGRFVIIGQFVHPEIGKLRDAQIVTKDSLGTTRNDLLDDMITGFEADYQRKMFDIPSYRQS